LLKKIDHIGIAVDGLQEAINQYAVLFEKEAKTEKLKAQNVDLAMFSIGESRIELLQGTSSDSVITRYIRKFGPGLHHICFEVENLDKCREHLLQKGFRFVDLPSSEGAHGSRIAFIHPESATGVLIELVEYPDNEPIEAA
jgi:methylmalonyl-CoA/ethylmalonyl-CoA epimerase